MRRSKAATRGGELSVTVIEGRNLKNTRLFGTQSPYCVVVVDRQERQTEVHDDGGTNPFWNALFTFDIDHSCAIELHVTATSACMPSTIGYVSIPVDLELWRDRELKEEWFPVQKSAAATHKTQGELRVRIEFKLASTLHKHPSVISIPVRKEVTSYKAEALTKVQEEEEKAASQPPSPSPAQKPAVQASQPSQTAQPSVKPPSAPTNVANQPPKLPVAANAVPPRTPTATGKQGPNWADVPGLKAFERLYISPALLIVNGPHINGMQEGTYENDTVYIQHDLAPAYLATALQVFPSLPKENHLLALRGFTYLNEKWCGVFDYAPQLKWTPQWTPAKLQIAIDIAHAMVQLHVAKQTHGCIQMSRVYRHQVKSKLIAFPRRPALEDIPLPWAAPELLENPTAFTPKMDVYAFGMLLIELDQGKVPFADEIQSLSRSEFLAKAADRVPTLSADCPERVAALIKKCLNVLPAKRPTSLIVLDLLREIKTPTSTATTPAATNTPSNVV